MCIIVSDQFLFIFYLRQYRYSTSVPYISGFFPENPYSVLNLLFLNPVLFKILHLDFTKKESGFMKIIQDFICQTIDGHPMLIPAHETSRQFDHPILLTPLQAFLWEKMQVPFDKNDLYNTAVSAFVIDRTQAVELIDPWLDQLIRQHIVS